VKPSAIVQFGRRHEKWARHSQEAPIFKDEGIVLSKNTTC